jgi:hypothetical protein
MRDYYPQEALSPTQDNKSGIMSLSQKAVILICLIALCAIPVYSSASLPMVGFPLKPSPEDGPYQDDEFIEKANTSIYSLSNKTVPTGLTLRDLQSVQQQLSKMSISPEFYDEASTINAFLYYTTKAGDEYDDAMTLSNSPYSPVTEDSAMFNDANEYYLAAKNVWEKIKSRYPDVTLYTMGSASSGSAENNLYAYDTPVSSRGHSGLW